MSSSTILLAEDDEDIRESLAELLESDGYTVTKVENGRLALDWIEREAEAPALVLLDLMMPVMTGEEFVAALASSADESKRAVPIIVLTASRERIEAPSIVANMRKPIDIDELRRVIDGILA